jgi:hypothetical protein
MSKAKSGFTTRSGVPVPDTIDVTGAAGVPGVAGGEVIAFGPHFQRRQAGRGAADSDGAGLIAQLVEGLPTAQLLLIARAAMVEIADRSAHPPVGAA